jgi:16S rRNA processing protein RimM
MTAEATQIQWAWLARIRRAQGRKGEVFADILTDFPEKFAERRRLWLIADPDAPHPKTAPLRSRQLPREAELRAHWQHKGGIVLHFAACESISDAESLSGLIVAIPLEDRVPLHEDEVYISDLIGSTVFDISSGAPIPVGDIENVDREAGPVPLLVVRSAVSPDEILVPFAKSYLRLVDLQARRVVMALPEGLVELNRASSTVPRKS